MRYPGKGKVVQMISKLVTYATIVFGGTISGALVGILAGPVRILMSTEEVGILGACWEPAWRLLAASSPWSITRRGSKTVSSSGPWKPASPGSSAPPSLDHSTIDGKAGSPRAEPPVHPDDRRPGLPTGPRVGTGPRKAWTTLHHRLPIDSETKVRGQSL